MYCLELVNNSYMSILFLAFEFNCNTLAKFFKVGKFTHFDTYLQKFVSSLIKINALTPSMKSSWDLPVSSSQIAMTSSLFWISAPLVWKYILHLEIMWLKKLTLKKKSWEKTGLILLSCVIVPLFSIWNVDNPVASLCR